MLENAVITSGLVLAGAALVLPATRNFFLGSLERDWYQDQLEFDCIDRDGVTVKLKDKSLFRAFSIKGTAYETKPQAIQENLCNIRSDLLHQLGKLGINIRFTVVKREQDVSFDTDWPSVTLTEIGDAEQKIFKHSYEVRWIMVIQSKNFNALDKASQKIEAILDEYQVQILRAASNPEEACPLTNFIHFLTSGEYSDDLPAISSSISGNIPACNIKFSDDGLITTFTPHKKLSRVIAVRLWPAQVQGLILTEILALKGELELSQVCLSLHTETALTKVKHKEGQFENKWFGNVDFAGEHNYLSSELSGNTSTIYETQFQIICRANSEEELSVLIDDVSSILSKRRVLYSLVTDEAAVCWFNRMPGKNTLGIGLNLINHNIAALWCFQYSPKGLNSSPFGKQPIRLFNTPTGQSYSFQFHCSDKKKSPGNYLIFAGTGSGKSTLILHLLGGLTKFPGVRNYVFDSKEGARSMVESLGGSYQSYDNLQLNPLDVVVDTLQARQNINMIIKSMIGDALIDDMDDAINHAISTAFKLEPPVRTFSNIFDLSFPPKSPIRRAMQRWVKDKKGKVSLYSHVFNAPHDQLSSFLKTSFLTGINMNEALKDDVLGPPVVAHISTAISAAANANNSGFTIFIDEAANLLRNKGFREVVLEMYREYRKLDGLTGMAFQDPMALLRVPDYEGILNNTQTLMFFPNPLVKPQDLEAFNLNEEQINFVTGKGIIRNSREVLIVKRDRDYYESAIVNVDLSDLGKPLRFYQAGAEANSNLLEHKQKWGDQWLENL